MCYSRNAGAPAGGRVVSTRRTNIRSSYNTGVRKRSTPDQQPLQRSGVRYALRGVAKVSQP
jgi:hypothetical protein